MSDTAELKLETNVRHCRNETGEKRQALQTETLDKRQTLQN